MQPYTKTQPTSDQQLKTLGKVRCKKMDPMEEKKMLISGVNYPGLDMNKYISRNNNDTQNFVMLWNLI